MRRMDEEDGWTDEEDGWMKRMDGWMRRMMMIRPRDDRAANLRCSVYLFQIK